MHKWHALSTPAAVHLPMTLCGGQCFRWRPTPRGTWFGVVDRTAYELCVASEQPPLPSPQHSDEEWEAKTTPSCSDHTVETLWFRCLSSELANPSDVSREVLFLRHYLALDVDLQKLWMRWTVENPKREHPLVLFFMLHKTAELPICIRHLRQDIHETLFAFLCSQNNNVQRIKGLVEKLATTFGDYLCDYNLLTGDVRSTGRYGKSSKRVSKHLKISDEEHSDDWIALYCLPTIEQLAQRSKDDLQMLGFGYRSRFIVDCASIIQSAGVTRSPKEGAALGSGHVAQLYKWYDDLLSSNLTLSERRQKLLSLPGVGRKVSDCVLLFAVGHHEIVPVDTHMAQVAMEYLAKGLVDECNFQGRRKRGSGVKWGREEEGQIRKSKGEISSWDAVLADWYRKAKVSDLKMPALLPKHHDAIQNGFRCLFGDYCGWAHSILFYTRINGTRSES